MPRAFIITKVLFQVLWMLFYHGVFFNHSVNYPITFIWYTVLWCFINWAQQGLYITVTTEEWWAYCSEKKMHFSKSVFYTLKYLLQVFDFFSYLTISHLLAIPLTLICEMPFGNLDKHIFRNVRIFPIPRPKKKLPDEKDICMSKTEPKENGENLKQKIEILSTP